jgi:hypothetical protein
MNLYTSETEYLKAEVIQMQKIIDEMIEALNKLGLVAQRTQNGIEIFSTKRNEA